MVVTAAQPAAFSIVGIGASAGGLEAFMQWLGALPEQAGMAFVLVAHLDPTHASKLAESLSKAMLMQVFEATLGLAIQSGCVYVIAPNMSLSLAELREADRIAVAHESERPGKNSTSRSLRKWAYSCCLRSWPSVQSHSKESVL